MALEVGQSGGDALAIEDWIRIRASRRLKTSLHVRPGSAGRRSYIVRPDRAGAVETTVRIAKLGASELFPVVAGRRIELMKHYGLPLRTEALEAAYSAMCQKLGEQSDNLVQATFDLVDGAIMAYRQALISSMGTAEDFARINEAFSALAHSIEEGKSVGRSVREFEATLRILTGQEVTATMSPAFIGRYNAIAG